MGTRHLIAVQLDGEYRIAQYGQWDGYPSAQGEQVLHFLRNWDRPTFEAKLRAASYCTDADWAAIKEQIKKEQLEQSWQNVWPELSRDAGARILEIVAERKPGIKLKNSIGFACDSLFCEWGYVIDLDANVLEVFRGFQKEPLPEGERFANAKSEDPQDNHDGYYPIRKVASFPLDKLPTQKKFEKTCDPPDEAD